jgi:pseudouridine-5'-phosphate glycosidase
MLSIRIQPEIEAALSAGHAVVALESTLISHGLPNDRRLGVAQQIEDAVREEGAVPATIAIIDGAFCVGLDGDQLRRVAFGNAEKASTRDLAVAIARGGVWATTVAATLFVAHRAGLRVFATGGIGGVHREAEQSFDESADLIALARLPLLVVSAGAKAVLDLPRTMERLETLGVPVIGFRTDELPAFYHAKSGLALTARVDTAEDGARIMRAQLDLVGAGGLLLVQAPPEDVAQKPEVVSRLIEDALEEARAARIRGRGVTPFVLAALDRASGGGVVDTNVSLIVANARLAARVARADRELAGGGLIEGHTN